MGKAEEQLYLQQQQIQRLRTRRTDSTIFRERCSMRLSRIGEKFSFKCVFVLILSVSVFLSAIFWVLPLHSNRYGFDAKDANKRSATIQAYFRLQKPVSMLVPHIARLEYDIYGEIGVPFTKVAILSMHQAGASNWTDVVFGVLSDPMDISINSVSFSVLKSSLIELFLQQSNLSLTTSIFGQPSSFEILKFQGGITVIPKQSTSFWQIPQILFNFTLPNSIDEIKENFVELKEQLKLGLHLRPCENVYVQITNKNGSTRDLPVTVQASVMSDLGNLLPQRLKQLAQIITGSPPAKNLGLNNSVFGKVKEISLSSYLDRTLHGTPPTSSPAPSPGQNDYAEPSVSPHPALSPSYSPAPSPDFHHLPPCYNCDASSPSDGSYQNAPSPESGPIHSLHPIPSSPAPSTVDIHPPCPSPHCDSTISPSPSPAFHPDPTTTKFSPHASIPHPSPPPSPTGLTSQLPPDLSPLPSVSYGSPGHDKGNGRGSTSMPLVSPSSSPSPSSSATSHSYKEIWLFSFLGLLTFHLLYWS